MSDYFVPVWPRAHGGPSGQALLKSQPEDFIVHEELGFPLTGSGAFIWLHLEKRGENTHWVAGKIAEIAGVRPAEIGLAGLKDRHAVARQWFSVPLSERREPDWSALESNSIRLLAVTRHQTKLDRGDHWGNRFQIRLRQFTGDTLLCEERLERIASLGFPNYFGMQRFGRQNGNLQQAYSWFSADARPRRSEQGFLLSAVRGLLFNHVLAKRVEAGSWNQVVAGDLMEAADSGQAFAALFPSDQVKRRCETLEITPTGPLYGAGQPKPSRKAGEIEQAVLAEHSFWCKGLERQKMRADRRPLRALASGLQWAWEGPDLNLSFGLGAGSYATVMVQELIEVITS